MDPYYKEARKRVKAKKGFYSHLTAFIIINGFMSLMMLFDGEPFGFLPPTLMWGIGLAFHYVKVFGVPGTGGIGTKTWEEKEIEKELQRMDRKALPPNEQPTEERLELKEVQKKYRDEDLV